jgi:anti-sigma-K factor RskA
MTERTHDEMRALIAPYVLAAVPEEEVAMIRAHIVTCEECLAEAERFAETAASLALLGGDEEELPAGFADRVLAEVRPAGSPSPTRAGWWRTALAGATALLVIAVGALGVLLFDTRSDLSEARALTEAIVTTAPGIELDGERADRAKLLTQGEEALFVATGMDEPPAQRTYQLWFIEDGTPVSAGTFAPQDGVAVLRVPRAFGSDSAAAVTIEPLGGSPEPTTDPILTSA